MGENVYYYDENGDLVPKPGNKRDPGRRYRGVGSKTIEFTPEEEAARDAEEAEWEAKRPEREAEEARKLEERRKRRESFKYEMRLVAFVDILGWEAEVDKTKEDPERAKDLGVALDSISAQADLSGWMQDRMFPGDFRYVHFSDTVVMSVGLERFEIGRGLLESNLHTLVVALMGRGLFCRGGVCMGQLFHEGATIFGPAHNAAYRLEKTMAAYPRIILDPVLSAAIGVGEPITDMDGSYLRHESAWRPDVDGLYFFDFLHPLSARAREMFTVNPLLNHVRPTIEQNLERHRGNPNVHSKYQWLARYFDAVLAEYPETDLEPFGLLPASSA